MNVSTNATAKQHGSKNAAQQIREPLGVRAYLRPAEAARHIGIGLSTLWRYLANRDKTGFPEPKKVSDRVTLFKRDDLEAWVDSRSADGRAA